jgi:hypothetical protein
VTEREKHAAHLRAIASWIRKQPKHGAIDNQVDKAAAFLEDEQAWIDKFVSRDTADA